MTAGRHPNPRHRRTVRTGAALVALAGATIAATGCRYLRSWWPGNAASGQGGDKVAATDFDIESLRMQPRDSSTGAFNFAKPGHLQEGTWTIRSNRRDLAGWLEVQLVDRETHGVIPAVGRRHELFQLRQVILPKGESRQVRFVYWMATPKRQRKTLLRHAVSPRIGAEAWTTTYDPVTLMAPHEFFLVVLAEQPDRYGFLKVLDTVRQPRSELLGTEPPTFYRVVLADRQPVAGVPQTPLAWTSIAAVVWDRFPLAQLTGQQQQALIDWLHFGGQLIISGPGSLEPLRGSFLEAFLPVRVLGRRSLSTDDFATFNATFAIQTPASRGRAELAITAGRKLEGAACELVAPGRWVPGTGQLVADRRVGRGRVIVTLFPLSDRNVINWCGFDSFVNACLLGRPRRQFKEEEEDFGVTVWRFVDPPFEDQELHPLVHSGVRLFSRDAGANVRLADWSELPRPFDGHRIDPDGGVAGGMSESHAIEAARRALSKASGLDVPDASFVWRTVLLYVVLLVPVNWLLFRLLGRVEWAWAAVPVLAVAGAAWVVRAAQMDIGFARSRTEVGILELHAGHPRGHLTREMALYTSLATPFTLHLDDPGGLIRPRAAYEDTSDPRWFGLTRRAFRLVRAENTRLDAFQVDSNTSEIVHTEQFLDVGGSIQWRASGNQPVLVNDTTLALDGAAVLRRSPTGRLEGAWIGRLEPRQQRRLRFQPLGDPAAWFTPWDEDPTSRKPEEKKSESILPQINLHELLVTALRHLVLRPGEARLVAWADGPLPGLEIKPAITQVRAKTLVLVHLHFAPFEPPRPDVNLIADVAAQQETAESDDVSPAGQAPRETPPGSADDADRADRMRPSPKCLPER